VGDLQKCVEVLLTMGCRVLRHEEFESGCEATCNGPYSGHWSKTMVGFADEDDSFVFELTYNYGINNYTHGNDLDCIMVHRYNSSGIDIEELINPFKD
jgi:hypothetical protein